MSEWFKGLKITIGILFGAVMVGVTIGASSVGWLTVPARVAALENTRSADSFTIMQNRRSITTLNTDVGNLTSGLSELLELVRTIDRRTCITSADGSAADLAECANR